MSIPAPRDSTGTLADVIDRVLDKGLVINADIGIRVVGVELLDIRIRAALASFETAAMYGLEFPGGTKLPEWASRKHQLPPLHDSDERGLARPTGKNNGHNRLEEPLAPLV